ncbi:MAG: DUF2071 domain-containing protein [Spirochaetia bacterium]|nr:DUF2071 domain-containing protein [Spirochaetia bacterium]
MFAFLKRHPFAVHAHFDFSAVMTFAYPSDILRPLLPPGLTLDERDGHGFLAIAMVHTQRLRPFFVPGFLGNDFFLIGYRIFSRFETSTGKRLRGLRILQSETDRAKMVIFGNLLTHYNYSRADIRWEKSPETIHVTKDGPEKFDVIFHREANPPLPAESIFKDWREARMYAGPLPFTFDYEKETHSIVVIEGVRQNWDPVPARIQVNQCDFLKRLPFAQAKPRLCSAFVLENIPYMWKRGRREALGKDTHV